MFGLQFLDLLLGGRLVDKGVDPKLWEAQFLVAVFDLVKQLLYQHVLDNLIFHHQGNPAILDLRASLQAGLLQHGGIMGRRVNNVFPVISDQLLVQVRHRAADLDLYSRDVLKASFQCGSEFLKEVERERLAEE